MAELKTQPTDDDVETFLASIPDDQRRSDARLVCDLLARITGESAQKWGSAIIGFGHRTLHYDNGRQQDWMVIGFSPRKASTTVYLAGGMESYTELLARLGKHTTSGGCLHLKRVNEVDAAVLEAILRRSIAQALGQ